VIYPIGDKEIERIRRQVDNTPEKHHTYETYWTLRFLATIDAMNGALEKADALALNVALWGIEPERWQQLDSIGELIKHAVANEKALRSMLGDAKPVRKP
jgi:hypothetical protein